MEIIQVVTCSGSDTCDSLRFINGIINAKIPHVEGVRKLLLFPRKAGREK